MSTNIDNMTIFVLDPSCDTIASVPRSSRQYQKRQYRDKQFLGGEQEWRKKLDNSSTVYVGNLSCYTNEYQLYELFTRAGSIKRIIMGLDRIKKIPCGFCFVEYDERSSALNCIKYLNRTHLDGRDIQIDMDAGFQEGRQYGRGSTGGQIGDERRRERESGGGYGNRGDGNQGSGAMLTRSITVVACLTLISLLLIVQQPERASAAETNINIRPFMPFGGLLGGGYSSMINPYASRTGRYVSLNQIRQAQVTKQRKELETDLALFLVNLMKSAKPTLMKAFIKATLADKQLKETAIGLFFGGDEVESEESEEKDKDKNKDKDQETDKDKEKSDTKEKESRKEDKDKSREKRKGTKPGA